MLSKSLLGYNLMVMFKDIFEYLSFVESPVIAILYLCISAKDCTVFFNKYTFELEKAVITLHSDDNFLITADTLSQTIQCTNSQKQTTEITFADCDFVLKVLQEYLYHLAEMEFLNPIPVTETTAKAQIELQA